MGDSGCLFKRKCAKQTGSSRNFCEEWTHVCSQCGSIETGTAERTGCQWDWSPDWSNMDWTEIYRGLYAGSVWNTGAFIKSWCNKDPVFRCDRAVECEGKKCRLWELTCKHDIRNQQEKCVSDFGRFPESEGQPCVWHSDWGWQREAGSQ